MDYKKVDGVKACYKVCPVEYPNEIIGENKCTLTCPSSSPLIDKDNRECLTSCNNSQSNYLQYNNECVAQCPNSYLKIENGICIFNTHLKPQSPTESTIDLPLNETVPLISDNILHYVNQTIRGDGFITQIYPSHSPPNDISDISSINIEQCESLLRREYKIPPGEELIIVKYDIICKDTVNNQVEYAIYDSKGNKIDTSICGNVSTDVWYPINGDIELGKGETMQNKGIDIYDGKSDYFNDISVRISAKEVT